MASAVTPTETVEQDIELIDLSDLVDEIYAENQVERPGIICDISA
ncbi:hypothetical protein QQY24_00915 [Streptomyces sp. TG1A-8]|nr:hypothetical protein [Streptomyces sp. TG1A-8]MDO0924066.1 hypothetical protein [Streptomyces sp. TG1A-8]